MSNSATLKWHKGFLTRTKNALIEAISECDNIEEETSITALVKLIAALKESSNWQKKPQ